jgi:hypothetical protein
VAVRVGRNTPDRLFRRIAEVQRHGGGVVAIYNEDVAIEALVNMATIEYPAAALEREVQATLDNQKARLQQIGFSFENYLRMTGHTEAQLREEIRPDAEKRLARNLALNELARAEKLEVSGEELGSAITSIAPARRPRRAGDASIRRYAYGHCPSMPSCSCARPSTAWYRWPPGALSRPNPPIRERRYGGRRSQYRDRSLTRVGRAELPPDRSFGYTQHGVTRTPYPGFCVFRVRSYHPSRGGG